MWLLNTDNYTLRQFDKPPGRYAILSHVWQHDGPEPEQDFHQVHAARSAKSISRKIREFCKHARAQGFHWAWADTCCVDRANSVEFSEATNAVFAWYAGAGVCFAYLHDVGASEPPAGAGSAFRRSAWFRRMWTLPELLAPRNMVFCANDWTALGTKAFFADVLAEITGIDVAVLTFSRPLSSVSVAERMSWASGREATLVEDEAYALLGIFDVNMPTMYGEGRRAFQRLQEEIMRTSPDQTLFVWGESVPRSGNYPTHDPSPTTALYAPPYDSHNDPAQKFTTHDTLSMNLMAPSPSRFKLIPSLGPPMPISDTEFAEMLSAMICGMKNEESNVSLTLS